MEDFWSRQANAQAHAFAFAPFGVPAEITANDAGVLAAARLSAGRFSRGEAPAPAHPMHIQIVVRRSSQATAPVPDDLPERLVYSGLGEWITVSAGEWGHGFANLRAREAHVFLSPALAAEARWVSRYFIDHYVLNFLLTEWAMLHASCILDSTRERLIVMVAPHNVGKSTTALRLLQGGYIFLADGMALMQCRSRFERDESGGEADHTTDVTWSGDELLVGGYPIGEVKLRDDVLAAFPEYAEEGHAVQVREHRKTVVDLRRIHAGCLAETLFIPSAIRVCLVERTSQQSTRLAPIMPEEALPVLAANTVYWDEAPRLAHNTATLNHLLRMAQFYRLSIGTDLASLIATMEELS